MSKAKFPLMVIIAIASAILSMRQATVRNDSQENARSFIGSSPDDYTALGGQKHGTSFPNRQRLA